MTASLEYGPTLRNFNRLFASLELLDVEAFLDPLKKDLFFRCSMLKEVALVWSNPSELKAVLVPYFELNGKDFNLFTFTRLLKSWVLGLAN